MALLPTQTPRKLKLFAAARPNYADYNGPPDGDYVRYVEGLMAWAEQEQERLRLKGLGDKSRSSALASSEQQWGRTASPSTAAVQVTSNTYAQPGSVDTAVDRLKRKAQAQAAKLQQQARSVGKEQPAAAGAVKKTQNKEAAQSSWVLFIGALVAVSIFATSWLPVVIIAWVAFNIFRTVRAASRSGKS